MNSKYNSNCQLPSSLREPTLRRCLTLCFPRLSKRILLCFNFKLAFGTWCQQRVNVIRGCSHLELVAGSSFFYVGQCRLARLSISSAEIEA